MPAGILLSSALILMPAFTVWTPVASAADAAQVRVDSFRLLNEGVAAYNRGRYAEAVDKLRQSSAVALNSFRAYYFLGLALIGDQRYEEALDALEIALELDPFHLHSLVAAGNAHLKMGQIDDSIASYYRALKLRAEYPNALDGIARCQQAQGKNDKAIEFFRRAIASNKGYAEAYTHLGDLYIQTGRYQVAVRLLTQAVTIRPDFTPGLYRLAEGYRTLGMYHDAVVYIEKAIQLAPTIPAYPATLGMIQIKLGLLLRANESFGKALDLDPTLAGPHRGMAEIARRNGDYTAALEQIDSALEDNRIQTAERSELEQFRSEVAAEEIRLDTLLAAIDDQTATTGDYSLLAGIHARRGEWTRAAELERLGEREIPGLLGYYLLKAGDFATAEQFYRDYSDTDGNPDLLLNHGIALAALGRDQDAADLYREALEMDEGHALAWLYLGNAYVRLGRNEAAVDAFRRFLQTGTEQHTSERVRRILEQLSNGDGA